MGATTRRGRAAAESKDESIAKRRRQRRRDASSPPHHTASGEEQEGERGGRRLALVTVGTTEFDDLIRAADHPAVADALVAAGFTDLTLQIGRGAYVPHRLGGGDGTDDAKGSSSGGGEGAFVYEAVKGKARRRRKAGSTSLRVSFFRLAPTLAPLLEDADLVLSHAGAGSLFEALAAGCAVVAVPNPALMGDHQAELAERLASEGWLVACDIRGGGSALACAAADAASTAGGGARYDPMDARNIATRIMALA